METYGKSWRRYAGMSFAIAFAMLIVISPVVGQETSHSGGDWPQFRGMHVDGTVQGSGSLATGREIRLDIGWRAKVGSGYSGVSVGNGLAVTMYEDKEAAWMVAFDPETGQEKWRYKFGRPYPGHDGSHDGPISTPVIYENTAIGLSPYGRLFAVDTVDGEPIWSHDLVKDLSAAVPIYGFGTSPIVVDGTLVVQVGAEAGAIAGFDPRTGVKRWVAGDDTIDYQSPIPLSFGGRNQVLAAGRESLVSIDAKSGEILWTYPHQGGGFRGMASMVPVPAGEDRLFLAYKSTSSAGVKLHLENGAVAGEQLWDARTIRNSYAVAVYHEGYLYGFSSRFLTCVDAATGKAKWKSREPGDGFLILVDGHLVLQTKAGSLHIAKANPERYQEIASLKLFDELAWTPPSFANGHIYLRSLEEVVRVDIGTGIDVAEDTDTGAPAAPEFRVSDAVTGEFADFLTEVSAATDKSEVVDRFIARQSQFPMIEGSDLAIFVYRGPGNDLAVAGDMIGSRQEAPMIRVDGTDLFYFARRMLPNARVNYMFVRDYEEIADPLNPNTTTSYILRRDWEFGDGDPLEVSWLAMPEWQAPTHLNEQKASASQGRIEEGTLHSEVLGADFSFSIYLPAGYDEGDQRYPVIYHHGGKGAIGPGRVPLSLDNLIGSQLEPVIVVFIEQQNQVGLNQLVEFVPAKQHADIWAKEVVPYIDKNYRTRATSEGRAHVGAGPSSLEALWAAYRHPTMADRLAVQSVYYLTVDWNPLEAEIKAAGRPPLQVYLEWGAYDLHNPQEAWDARVSARELRDFLRAHGATVTGGEVADGTGFQSWKNRTDVVLRSVSPGSPVVNTNK